MDATLLAPVLVILAGLFAMVAAFNIITVIASLLLRVPVASVAIGAGPRMAGFRMGGADVSFALLPLAGHVRFVERPAPPDDPEGRLTIGALEEASTLTRVLLALAGPLGAIGAAAMVLGLRAVTEAAAIPAEVWRLLTDWSFRFDPLTVLNTEIRAGGYAAAIALVVAKAAGLNLLPLPPLSGWAAIWQVLAGLHPRVRRAHGAVSGIGLVIVLGLVVALLARTSA